MGVLPSFASTRAARLAGVLLRHHTATEIADTIELLVDMLDLIDGDPDVEPNGDENDGTGGEDEFCNHNVPTTLQGPGCPISDFDVAIDDGPCDDENDDREHEEVAHPRYGVDQRKQLPWQPSNDIRARQPHRDRIRATRCETSPRGFFGMVGREYRLRDDPVAVVIPHGQRGKLTRLF
jgi:hypothetical protein